MREEESPPEVRERAASASTSQGDSRPLARGGFERLAEKVGTVMGGKKPQPNQSDSGREFRLRLKALNHLLILEATRGTGGTKTICGVVILGLDQLYGSREGGPLGDVTALDQALHEMVNAGLVPETESILDFAQRWRDALLAHMGADEVQALALLDSEPHHLGHR